ncbi:ABC transporter permease protein [Streptococcus criceti]|uniref:ABC3 transporter permease C-terminal domain-containing protein n=1 Tax=Streptococcus criceti HS-6 TaxID=873449 RepID=G5JPE4_STRCG|nr:hypothetical protein STRCR_1596 [Streptococcus criceti HS-6]SUN43472.1 ABC transporter permease protein [Streptococcus criceti]
MTLFDFALNNIKRDFRTYLYHFLSCTFSVFIFFLFTTLAQHPALAIVDSSGTIGLVLFLTRIVSVAFAFVLILYSVGNFLKIRSKQFAILNIIGASKKQFSKLIFLENMILSTSAMISGIIMGIIFSKLFLMLAQQMIGRLDLHFYFPLVAVLLTIVFMGSLFLVVALLAPVILRKKEIIVLLKKEEVTEKNHFILSLLAIVLILPLTVYLHLISGETPSIFIYVLDLLSYVSSTYFICYLIFTIYASVMKKSGRLYSKQNLVTVSDFKYKINTNIKTMTGVMILFSIVLTSLVYIVGAPRNIAQDTKKVVPYSYMYANWENQAKSAKKADTLSKTLSETDDFKQLTIDYAQLKSNLRTTRHIILSNTMYNAVADFLHRNKLNLTDDSYFLVGVDGKAAPVLPDNVREKLADYHITKKNGLDKRVIALSGYFTSVTVVSDKKYEELSQTLTKDTIYAFDQVRYQEDKAGKMEELEKAIGFEKGKETLISYYMYYDNESLTRKLVSYVGSILCVSFLIGMASIIYSRLYSALEEESKKYSIMMKIGLSQSRLKAVTASTLRWLFLAPFAIALGISGLFVIIINQITLTSYTELAFICYGVCTVIEIILYLIVRNKYQKQVFNSIYETNG